MQRALLAALLLAPLCGLLGVFVTARRMAFFSDTVAHSALAGVALSLWLGLSEPTPCMLAVGIAVAAAMVWLKDNTDLLSDTIMALLLSGAVSIGMVGLSLLKASRGDVHRFLFGDILAVSWLDVGLAGVLLALVGIGGFRQMNALTLITVQEELAHVCGVPVRRMNYLFILVLTAAVALSIRLLGIVLVTSLLVIPPAASRNLSRNLRQQIVGSLAIGCVGAVAGLLLSYTVNVPCGPAIVLASLAIFLVTLGLQRFRKAI